MSEEFLFLNYLLECYATYRGIAAGKALEEWDVHGITQTVYDNYWGYHSERIENAFEDIDCLLKTGKHV